MHLQVSDALAFVELKVKVEPKRRGGLVALRKDKVAA